MLAGSTGAVRLNADGSLDTTFSADGISTAATSIITVKVLADGKLLLGSRPSVTRLNADGSLDTTFGDAVGGGSVNTLGGSVAYTENARPVFIDTSVVLIDSELSALNGGTGNYAGASVTVSRQSGANAQDVLAIDAAGASFTLSGTTSAKRRPDFWHRQQHRQQVGTSQTDALEKGIGRKVIHPATRSAV